MKKNILFVASEAVPFIKTGGLADVAGTLPKYFDKEQSDVRVIIPKYACMRKELNEKLKFKLNFYMPFCGDEKYVGLYESEVDGIKFYLIDNEYYFNGGSPYSDDSRWDVEKFLFFSQAALSALPSLGFRPDIIHCHDWQTGIIPVLLQNTFQDNEFYRGMHAVMTIHNLKFQGVNDAKMIQWMTGLPDYFFTDDKLGFYGGANLLKGGIIYADRVTTVSETYAKEIRYPFYGEKLDGLLRAKENVLCGIVNGIDYDQFNPETDNNLAAKYSVKTFKKEKYKNKLALQRELGLKEDKNVLLIGLVSRLTDQKGIDLIDRVLDELCQDYLQFVVVGTGEYRYEEMLKHFAWKYPDKVSANICYSEALSHKVYGSCDAFLMPSLFEPCGLSQLMSLRYGTVPIVRETGGLKDTVIPYNEYEHTGTGFSFANYNAHEMMATIRYVQKVYYDDRKSWDGIVERAMKQDYSWNNSAAKYEQLYRDILKCY